MIHVGHVSHFYGWNYYFSSRTLQIEGQVVKCCRVHVSKLVIIELKSLSLAYFLVCRAHFLMIE